MPELRAEETRL
uniref:Uncharacterized protein n=2 Tax=PACMAD clade TaxID=147370 RepID=A0A0A9BRB0_ARUDO